MYYQSKCIFTFDNQKPESLELNIDVISSGCKLHDYCTHSSLSTGSGGLKLYVILIIATTLKVKTEHITLWCWNKHRNRSVVKLSLLSPLLGCIITSLRRKARLWNTPRALLNTEMHRGNGNDSSNLSSTSWCDCLFSQQWFLSFVFPSVSQVHKAVQSAPN